MTPQPHPQRCETCTHLKKHEIHNLYCEISGRKTPHGTLFMERVAELGCASHSSHPHTPSAPKYTKHVSEDGTERYNNTPAAPSERIGSIRTNVFMDEDKVWLIERVNAGMGEYEYMISYLGDHFATVPSEVIAREIVEMQCHTCPVFTPEHDATIRNQTLDEAIKVVNAFERKSKYDYEVTKCLLITQALEALKQGSK